MNKTYKGKVSKPGPKQIIVVGTNTEGRPGKGMALWCVQNAGLKRGHTKGLCGQTYGIVTKDLTKSKHPSISMAVIMSQISEMYKLARTMPEYEFIVPYNTEPNLNTYTPSQMALMFNTADRLGQGIPENIVFEEEFYKLIEQSNCLF